MAPFCYAPQTQQLSQDPCPSALHNQQLHKCLPEILCSVINKKTIIILMLPIDYLAREVIRADRFCRSLFLF